MPVKSENMHVSKIHNPKAFEYPISIDRGRCNNLRRRLSLPIDVKNVLSESEELKRKEANLWTVIQRVPIFKSNDPDYTRSGYIYTYKLRDEFDRFTSKNREDKAEALKVKQAEIFPAAEPNNNLEKEELIKQEFKKQRKTALEQALSSAEDKEASLIGMNIGWDFVEKPFFEKLDFISRCLKFLGFSIETRGNGVFLTVPDVAALNTLWEDLRSSIAKQTESSPGNNADKRQLFQPSVIGNCISPLPPLDIKLQRGNRANDQDFFRAFLSHDRLVSDKREFLHDLSEHVRILLMLLLSSHVSPQENISCVQHSIKLTLYKSYCLLDYFKWHIPQKIQKLPRDIERVIRMGLPQVEKCYSVFADSITTLYPLAEISETIFFDRIIMLFREPEEQENPPSESIVSWRGYMDKCFPKSLLTANQIRNLLDFIKEFYVTKASMSLTRIEEIFNRTRRCCEK